MTDKQLIQRLCDTIDTLSRGGAIDAIRIVREHDHARTTSQGYYSYQVRPGLTAEDIREACNQHLASGGSRL